MIHKTEFPIRASSKAFGKVYRTSEHGALKHHVSNKARKGLTDGINVLLNKW
jgi:hypothetical protein